MEPQDALDGLELRQHDRFVLPDVPDDWRRRRTAGLAVRSAMKVRGPQIDPWIVIEDGWQFVEWILDGCDTRIGREQGIVQDRIDLHGPKWRRELAQPCSSRLDSRPLVRIDRGPVDPLECAAFELNLW